MALFYFEGYDTDAAARFLDVPLGTLRRRLHDGRKHLRSAIEQLLQGATPMNDARNRRIERFQRLLDDDKVYEALRESLALRPPPRELIDRFMRRQTAHAGFFREKAHQLVRPSDRAGDPGHPVGSIAIAIQRARFSSYDEPRYRAALQLHLDEVAARAASGGVLTEWPGRPENTDAAHVRIFLEPWATVRSGCVVEFERILDPPIA